MGCRLIGLLNRPDDTAPDRLKLLSSCKLRSRYAIFAPCSIVVSSLRIVPCVSVPSIMHSLMNSCAFCSVSVHSRKPSSRNRLYRLTRGIPMGDPSAPQLATLTLQAQELAVL